MAPYGSRVAISEPFLCKVRDLQRVTMQIFSDFSQDVILFRYLHVYSNKIVTSNFHGTVTFDQVKMSKQK